MASKSGSQVRGVQGSWLNQVCVASHAHSAMYYVCRATAPVADVQRGADPEILHPHQSADFDHYVCL